MTLRPRRPRARSVGALLAAVVVTAGCSSGTRHPPPATGLTALVSGAPGAYTRVTVRATSSGRTMVLPPALAADVAPLVAARTFEDPEPLADYGLERPGAVITYVRAGAVQRLEIGGPDFDAHGFYVQRPGDPAVYLVLSGNIRPVLAAVGIVTPEPT